MKEEWLFPGAFVPVDVETTSALVAEVKRLIDVVGGLVLKQGPDYERGSIDGMMYQTQTSVGEGFHVEFLKEMGDDEVLLYAISPKRPWVGLTDEEFNDAINYKLTPRCIAIAIEAKLKELNT